MLCGENMLRMVVGNLFVLMVPTFCPFFPAFYGDVAVAQRPYAPLGAIRTNDDDCSSTDKLEVNTQFPITSRALFPNEIFLYLGRINQSKRNKKLS